jgi:hypothetical protein
LFDTPHREAEYHRTRDKLFPLDKHGSERGLKNRAGDKLIEVTRVSARTCTTNDGCRLPVMCSFMKRSYMRVMARAK